MKINKFLVGILSHRINKLIFMPGALLFLWISLSIVYSSDMSFSVLQYPHYQDKKNNFFGKKLLKGQRLFGEFSAKDNHLGIVAVMFGKVHKAEGEDEEIILFRIKEKKSKEWLYVNEYKLGLFASNDYFPFGFKEIIDSRGKIYIYEITSKNGRPDNSLETKNSNPIYLSEYKYSKGEIFGDLNLLMRFIKVKIITFITDFNSLLSSIVFLLPFIFYIAWISFPMKRFKLILFSRKKFRLDLPNMKSIELISPSRRVWIEDRLKIDGKKMLAVFIVSLIFYDIIIYEFSSTGFMLGILGLWIGIIFLNKFKSNVTFILTFIIIGISIFSIYFDLHIFIDKSSAFAYFLIIIGFIQSLGEHKSK